MVNITYRSLLNIKWFGNINNQGSRNEFINRHLSFPQVILQKRLSSEENYVTEEVEHHLEDAGKIPEIISEISRSKILNPGMNIILINFNRTCTFVKYDFN